MVYGSSPLRLLFKCFARSFVFEQTEGAAECLYFSCPILFMNSYLFSLSSPLDAQHSHSLSLARHHLIVDVVRPFLAQAVYGTELI